MSGLSDIHAAMMPYYPTMILAVFWLVILAIANKLFREPVIELMRVLINEFLPRFGGTNWSIESINAGGGVLIFVLMVTSRGFFSEILSALGHELSHQESNLLLICSAALLGLYFILCTVTCRKWGND